MFLHLSMALLAVSIAPRCIASSINLEVWVSEADRGDVVLEVFQEETDKTVFDSYAMDHEASDDETTWFTLDGNTDRTTYYRLRVEQLTTDDNHRSIRIRRGTKEDDGGWHTDVSDSLSPHPYPQRIRRLISC